MCCGNNCNEYIFWIGANKAASIQALHQFVFHEISKYVDVQQSGVKQHSFTFQRAGNEYCLTDKAKECFSEADTKQLLNAILDFCLYGLDGLTM